MKVSKQKKDATGLFVRESPETEEEYPEKSKNKKIKVSAPGKLMLLGEHAVVYGRPCIVTAVDQRMNVTVELTNEPIFMLNAPDVQILDYKKLMDRLGSGDIPKVARFVEVAIKNFSVKHPIQGGIKITTASQFSSQFGFGSSSASTVCVIYALSKLFKINLNQKQIFDLSYKTVLDIQGKGSGFDIAAAIYGGTLYFVTAGKVIKPLKINNFPLIVGYSGVKADTVELMDQVSQRAKKYPEVVENIYNNIGELVDQAKLAFLNKDWLSFGKLMNFNQGFLSALGVSNKKLADMIYSSREAGAYGAKLSGAGGGDCMIALAPPSKIKAVKQAITQAGGTVINVKANTEGVRIES